MVNYDLGNSLNKYSEQKNHSNFQIQQAKQTKSKIQLVFFLYPAKLLNPLDQSSKYLTSYLKQTKNSIISEMSTSTSSKPQKKQKKSEEQIQLQLKIESLIKQNLELTLTVKKLSQQSIQTKELGQAQQQIHKKSLQQQQQKIQKLELLNLAQAEHISSLRQKKQQYEIQTGCLRYKIQKLSKEFQQYKYLTKQEYEELKRNSESQIKKYQSIVNEYQSSINERLQYLMENANLKNQLDKTLQEHKRVVADKDRDKLQAIDFLKKDMNQRAKQLKATLLNMRRDQMTTNTRLTLLQNHQLLQELQYQSKHTQTMLKRNTQLQKKIQQLSKQLQVEKDINEQLAKRSTVGKKIIKSLNQKTTQLQKQIQSLKSTAKPSLKPSPSKHPQSLPQLIQTIQSLQQELNSFQAQTKKLEDQKNHFERLYKEQEPMYQFYLKTENDLRLLMIRFLNETMEGRLVGEENSVQYDISRLKDVHVNEWTKSDVEITVKMLLTFLKPHFNMKNLKAHYFKHKLQQNDALVNEALNTQNLNKAAQNSLSSKITHLKAKSFSTLKSSSTPSSPQKPFTLNSVLKDFKSKQSQQKILKSNQKKLHKSQSQHQILSFTEQNKFISGQQQSFRKYHQKQNLQEFQPQNWRKKESKKLTRTIVRQWGKKVTMEDKRV